MSHSSKFFQQVNYASFHEDSESERRALQLQSTDRVLCLTGSGARALDLLIDSPKEIVAVDWNAAQSHLLELKLAVIRRLDYQPGMTFLGFRSANTRDEVYKTLRSDLSEPARAFWDQRLSLIRRGVYFEGQWERFLTRASWLARWTRRRLVNEILSAKDIATQRSIWSSQWDNGWWRGFLAVTTNRWLVRYVLREPGLNFVPRDLNISECLRQRFASASGNFLFRESPWVWALFKGRIDEHGPLPIHLKPDNFETLRRNVDAVRVVTASLADYLRDHAGKFDAFSLSDFSSYCDQPTYSQLWEAILSRAQPGARFCERRFLVEHELPSTAQAAIAIDAELANRLTAEDRSLVYTFLVGRFR